MSTDIFLSVRVTNNHKLNVGFCLESKKKNNKKKDGETAIGLKIFKKFPSTFFNQLFCYSVFFFKKKSYHCITVTFIP